MEHKLTWSSGHWLAIMCGSYPQCEPHKPDSYLLDWAVHTEYTAHHTSPSLNCSVNTLTLQAHDCPHREHTPDLQYAVHTVGKYQKPRDDHTEIHYCCYQKSSQILYGMIHVIIIRAQTLTSSQHCPAHMPKTKN